MHAWLQGQSEAVRDCRLQPVGRRRAALVFFFLSLFVNGEAAAATVATSKKTEEKKRRKSKKKPQKIAVFNVMTSKNPTHIWGLYVFLFRHIYRFGAASQGRV